MTEYWTCKDVGDGPGHVRIDRKWWSCGKTHTTKAKAEQCCHDAAALSSQAVNRVPWGGAGWSRQEVEEMYDSYLVVAPGELKREEVGHARWLLHAVGANKVDCPADKQWGRVFSHHLRRMRDSKEVELYRSGTKKRRDAVSRMKLATIILELWPSMEDRHEAMNEARETLELARAGSVQPDVPAVEPAVQPDVRPAPEKEPKELSEKARVLRDLLELDDMEQQVYDRVMGDVAENEPLIDKICARANVPRDVSYTFPDRNFTVRGHQHPDVELLLQAMNAGINRIFTWGAPGLGKTHAAKQVAEAMDMQFFSQIPVADQYQLLGFKDATGTYHESEVFRWATCKGPALLLLDEVDASHPSAVLALNAMLENRFGVFPTGRVEFGEEKYVIGNGNTPMTGATADHNGRYKQDGAFADRFVLRFQWQDDPATEKVIAQKQSGLSGSELDGAVEAARKVRSNLKANGIQIAWGPRRTFAVAKLVAAGMTPRKACEFAGLQELDEGQRKRALKTVGGED